MPAWDKLDDGNEVVIFGCSSLRDELFIAPGDNKIFFNIGQRC